MTMFPPIGLLAMALAAAGALAQAPSGGDETTGRILYSAQCNGCHLKEVHWRDRKVAQDWPSLVREVRRWQQNSGLAWSDDEVLAVARYLNATWYRFPADAGKELARVGSEP